ncbi:MAG TPA: DUF72 domain-containing protein [Pirellulales bacterium]|jgi:uncharacterized protein YecE (DUF72 family)|nr:DUF72 domain-containing protein [Pirellulales bacterium]
MHEPLHNAMPSAVHLGVAGWSVPGVHREHFTSQGTHLARYAQRFNAVEINSSFYRPHRPATYARWAESTPDDFRFAVKMPRTITHQAQLADRDAELDEFLGQVHTLGQKLGPLLVQFPPSLACRPDVAARFFDRLRERHPGDVVCEPRHMSWFTDEAKAQGNRTLSCDVEDGCEGVMVPSGPFSFAADAAG